MKILCFYDMAADALPQLMAHFPAHRAVLDEFHSRGLLHAAGPLGNPPEGALAIFNSRERRRSSSSRIPLSSTA
jgi:uncharacterized protein YciI